MLGHRTARWFVVIPMVAVTSSGLIAASRPATFAGCTAVREWVLAHRRELPTTYAEIIRYPLDYRRHIQAALPWSVRRELWRTQYHVYAGSGLLDSTQVAFMAHAESKLIEMFDEHTTQARREAMGDSIANVASVILGRELTHRIFFVLGPESAPGARASADDRLTPSYFRLAANRRQVNVPQVFVNCTCHYGVPQPECTSAQTCVASNCTANGFEGGGCGTNGMYSCNGLCQ